MLTFTQMDRFESRILQFIKLRESVQIIGLPGTGKSRFIRDLISKVPKNTLVIYIDTNSLFDDFYIALLTFLGVQLNIQNLENVNNNTHLVLTIKSKVEEIAKNQQILIIIDSFTKLLDAKVPTIYKYLKHLRDINRKQISYIFTTNNVGSPEDRNLIGDLFEIFSEHIEYIPIPTDKEFYKEVVHRANELGFNPTQEQIKQIYSLSGKIHGLKKACIQALRDSKRLDYRNNLRLKGQLEELTEALTAEQLNYLISVSQEKDSDENRARTLRNLGLLTDSNKIRSGLLKQFVAQNYKSELTSAEKLFFDLLEQNKNTTITRKDICETVYPDVKNYEGITEHAIDQLVHRVRSKVSNKYKIETIRGRGYRLIENS